MWWPTHARAPLATQNVLLSSAPQASSGRAAPRQRQRVGHEPARAAQQQRAPARHRAQDRVVRARVDRAVVAEHEVGDAARAARARRRPRARSARRRRCRSSSPAARRRRRAAGGAAASRAAGRRGRRCAARPRRRRGASGRRGASTIGRSRPASSAASSSVSETSARAAATSRTITANGLSSRCLRARSAATAGSSRRRQARW